MDSAGTLDAAFADGADPVRSYLGLGRAELRSLVGLVSASDVVELEVSFPGGQISIRREIGDRVADVSAGEAGEDVAPTPDESLVAITSPLVGTFRPSITLGSQVEAGQTVGAVEAMGMPTPVDVPSSGMVVELLATDGSPVEYGQPLLVLRRPMA